jgi:hypothetical protein
MATITFRASTSVVNHESFLPAVVFIRLPDREWLSQHELTHFLQAAIPLIRLATVQRRVTQLATTAAKRAILAATAPALRKSALAIVAANQATCHEIARLMARLAPALARSATSAARSATSLATARRVAVMGVAGTAAAVVVVAAGRDMAVVTPGRRPAIPAAAMGTCHATALRVRSATTVSFSARRMRENKGARADHGAGGEVGHLSRDCPTETSNERVCYKCKQPGHVQAACPN